MDYLFTTQSRLLTTLKKALENMVGKRENAGYQHFLLFPVFSSLSKREILISATFNLSSANAFLQMPKMLSFGKELHCFRIVC